MNMLGLFLLLGLLMAILLTKIEDRRAEKEVVEEITVRKCSVTDWNRILEHTKLEKGGKRK